MSGDNCALCGTLTNHTTERHDRDMHACHGCGEDVRQWVKEGDIDWENVECPACRQERIEARVEGWSDALVKDSNEEGGQERTWHDKECHTKSAYRNRSIQWEENAAVLGRKIANLVSAREREARRLAIIATADWYEEMFCPRSGVPGDETHARGDCDHCNIAQTIRTLAEATASREEEGKG